MRLAWTYGFLVFLIIGLVQFDNVNAYGDAQEDGESPKNFLNEWVAEIEGGRKHAELVAGEHGFIVESELDGFPHHYHLTHTNVPHRSKRSAHHHTKRLTEDSRITFAEQQHQLSREKRGRLYSREIASHIAQSSGNLNDPQYHSQWYLEEKSVHGHVIDMQIKEAWKEGMTGRNVTLTIIDDGIEPNHPDLALNYEPRASYDFNDNDPDPTPRYDITNENKHGTRCAGEIAMMANNGNCGVGVAFNSRIGGYRILDGKVTDRLEGLALSRVQTLDISSASWGPNDDGMTTEGPGRMATKGIQDSITKGRGGKGSILVWAAGNGALYGDNCNSDGYTSDHRTFSVSSASEHGLSPWYAEKCASTLLATYSSGTAREKKVVTSDLRGKCTSEHSGTSAAAPMAAGVLALVLEANPDLTWRCVQHIAVATAQYEPLKSETGWYKNGVGRCVSLAFGYGLINAKKMVLMAKEWQQPGEQKICLVSAKKEEFPKNFTSGNSVEVEIETDGCLNQDQEINYLEHVKVILTLATTKRGNIYVEMVSPSGTVTPLMLERENDRSKKGFVRWPLTSVHNWGESPRGTWKVRVADRRKTDSEKASLKDVKLMLFGTKEKPFYHDTVDKSICGHLKQYPTMKEEKVEKDPMYQLEHLFDDLDFDSRRKRGL